MSATTLTSEEIVHALNTLCRSWTVNQQGYLYKEYKTRNFKHAMSLANIIFLIAEKINHHPNLIISNTKLAVEIWSHDLGGLSQYDFKLASIIDKECASRHELSEC